MMAILIRLLAITRDANRFLGSSKRFTILFQELSCFVFRILISLSVSEKKAIFEPETINDITSKNKMRMTRMVVACALMNSKRQDIDAEENMLLKG
jgi:hypothetical protein